MSPSTPAARAAGWYTRRRQFARLRGGFVSLLLWEGRSLTYVGEHARPMADVAAQLIFELPDGTELALPEGATGADAAAAIGPGLARAALAVKVDADVRDLARALPTDNGRVHKLEVITERSGAP